MRRWWKLFRWARDRRAGRPAAFDALFALSSVLLAGGLATLLWGVFVSDASAVPGLGIVCLVLGAYLCSVFGLDGAREEGRSVRRSLVNGFRQLAHLVRPPSRNQ